VCKQLSHLRLINYGLRKYEGAQDVDWPAVTYAPMAGLPPLTVPAMRSPLGNEPTLEAFIGHLVLCLREWRRVLRDDGVCFVNLGDSYFNTNPGSGGKCVLPGAGKSMTEARYTDVRREKQTGIKPKDLMLVPARFALAAQADGWWLRSDIIGQKVAPMPESVTDRPTRSHEHIFMLTKAARYFWDAEAAKQQAKQPVGVPVQTGQGKQVAMQRNMQSSTLGTNQGTATRNMLDVIEWRPSGFNGAHFATWPEAIPEKLIRAATSERGCCPTCGAAWVRVVERTAMVINRSGNHPAELRTRTSGTMLEPPTAVTVGWQPSCTCPHHDPIPCVVLDPFSGSGTTCKVAVRLGRRALGVDIAAEYLGEITAQRFGAGVQMELHGEGRT